jgi:hypothetical protein
MDKGPDGGPARGPGSSSHRHPHPRSPIWPAQTIHRDPIPVGLNIPQNPINRGWNGRRLRPFLPEPLLPHIHHSLQKVTSEAPTT